ncbi:DUF4260 family protein [Tardiphaga sp.]|jgi:hypothetical protein|uniref:DUF4260 family protein n=1 Tax=Tardiphaga sp. TaxID=1926292 RepID=UPI0037DA1116
MDRPQGCTAPLYYHRRSSARFFTAHSPAEKHGPRIGAGVYNATHATIGPLLLVLFGLVTAEPLPGSLAMIWLAHIGFDRMLGYGLKYETGFHFTHLGRIGKHADTAQPAATSPNASNDVKAA